MRQLKSGRSGSVVRCAQRPVDRQRFCVVKLHLRGDVSMYGCVANQRPRFRRLVFLCLANGVGRKNPGLSETWRLARWDFYDGEHVCDDRQWVVPKCASMGFQQNRDGKWSNSPRC